MKDTQQTYRGDEVAVIGMSLLFSEVETVDDFWKALKEGRELITFYSPEELKAMGIDDQFIQSENYVKIGSELPGKESFDAEFFNYLPNEARVMDPQIRLFHQCAWKALEDAGVDTEDAKNRIGLFAGASSNMLWKGMTSFSPSEKGVQSYALQQLNDRDFLPTLVSYKLNLKGPSLSINTACSTSLVAVHMAVRNLLLGECNIALAGGISLSSNPIPGYIYQDGMINSADGHCKTFDINSDGTVPGEGAGIVVLKKLKQALADRDQIYAIIKGSAINNDGNRKLGYTAPSIDGQVDCIKTAQKIARVEPDSIAYIEAHGTATQLGDPIEIEALNKVFGKSEIPYCGIGSLKSNLGHLDVAAGVAGLIKACLVLKNKAIPPSLHFTRPNPSINFENSAFSVVNQLTPLTDRKHKVLRAGVSSFGIGGTNAHVVLEEAPEVKSSPDNSNHKLLTLSAKTPESLKAFTETLLQFVKAKTDLNFADLSYTLQLGRKDFSCRTAFSFTNKEDLIAQLEASDEASFQYINTSTKIIFLFPGQGAQYTKMGKELYEQDPYFSSLMDQGFSVLNQLTNTDHKQILFADHSEDTKDHKINHTLYTQPLLFLLEYSLAKLMIHRGVTPDHLIGHSLGEYVAATISGVFHFEDALKLIVRRSQLMDSVAGGAMLSIALAEQDLQPLLPKGVSISAVNTNEQCVVSGSYEAIDDFSLLLKDQTINFIRLKVSHAFHSSSMDSILKDFELAFEDIECFSPNIPFISNITGQTITSEEARSPKYWTTHLREAVQFKKGVEVLMNDKNSIFIEIGPGNTLSNFIRHAYPMANCMNSFGKPKTVGEEAARFSQTFGDLWSQGIPVNWSSFYEGQLRKKIALPTYAFAKTNFPVRIDPRELGALNSAPTPTNVPHSVNDWFYLPIWKEAYLSAGQKEQESSIGYLVFCDDESIIQDFEQGFQDKKDQLIIVRRAKKFEMKTATLYTINPSEPSHYLKLLNNLNVENELNILYAWGLMKTPGNLISIESIYDQQSEFFFLLNLCQALEEQKKQQKRKLFFMTNNFYPVFGKEQSRPEVSPALGLLKVFGMENPEIVCVNIDLALDKEEALPFSEIYQELSNPQPDFQVSIRNKRRWICKYERVSTQNKKSLLKEKGTYLITGGTGNVGRCLGEHFIKSKNASLILIGKTVLPDEAQWEELDTKLPKDQSLLRRIDVIKKLRAFGGNVFYYSADFSDPEEISILISEIEKRHGQINGVVHAAGNMANHLFSPVSSIELTAAKQQFIPKIAGIISLYRAFKDRQLDFFWATSSLSTVLGGYTYGSYAAANSFMDAFLLANTKRLPNWKSIQLDNLNLTKNHTPGTGIGQEDLIEIFHRSLALEQSSQVLVSTTDLAARQIKYTQKQTSSQKQERPVQALRQRQRLSTPFVAASTDTEIQLEEIWKDFFEIEKVGVDDDFIELGGDSLKAMMLVKIIHKKMDVELSMKDFFEQPTLRGVGLKIDNSLWLGDEVSGKNKMVF